MLDADVVLTYDQRLAAGCIDGGLAGASPGSESVGEILDRAARRRAR